MLFPRVWSGFMRAAAAFMLALLVFDCDWSTSVDEGGCADSGGGSSLPPTDPRTGQWTVSRSNYVPTAVGGVPGDILAVGECGSTFRYDGGTWTRMMGRPTLNSLIDVWAADNQHVFAVGQGGTILRFDGSRWQRMTSPTTVQLVAVWGTSANDVFAVGRNGTICHYDGTRWTAKTITVSSNQFSNDYSDVCGSASDDVFAVCTGWDSPVVHFDGKTWSKMNTGVTGGLRALWVSSRNDVFVATQNSGVIHYDGIGWTPTALNEDVSAFWGTSSSDVYAVGWSTIYYYDGAAWSDLHIPIGYGSKTIWGSSTTDIFVCGGGESLHFDGASWTNIPLPDMRDTFTGVWCGGNDNIIVGRSGFVMRGAIAQYPNPTLVWYREDSGTSEDLAAVFQTTNKEHYSMRTRTFAVGANGTILSYEQGKWNPVASGIAGSLRDIWGSGADFVAVGDGGTILLYNGSQWAPMESGVSTDLLAVWSNGTAMQNLFAVGSSGVILHYDGSRWTSMTSGTTADLVEGWRNFAVGSDRTFLRYDGHSWLDFPACSQGEPAYTSVWGAHSYGFVGTLSAILLFHDYGACWQSATSPVVNGAVVAGSSDSEKSVAVTAPGDVLVYYYPTDVY